MDSPGCMGRGATARPICASWADFTPRGEPDPLPFPSLTRERTRNYVPVLFYSIGEKKTWSALLLKKRLPLRHWPCFWG